MRVGDYFAQRLKTMGVEKVFLVSGGGMMHLIDAIAANHLDYVCCHHEQACAMAAEAYARETGRLGACYATSGPGATNILTGLIGAWQDSSPVIFFTGQAKRSQTIALAPTPGLRQFGTFEVDIVPMVKSVTKYAVMIDDLTQVRYHFEKAVHLAITGRPGPVLLDVPLDVQGAQIDPDQLAGFTPPTIGATVAEADIDAVLNRLSRARRPVLLVGHGVRAAGAVVPFRQLADKLGAPVTPTQLAKDVLAYDHPLFVGHSGPKGDRAGNFALQSSDFILSMGCSLHAQTVGYEADLYAPQAYKVQVDIEQPILDRGDIPVDKRIEADITDFIQALLAKAPDPNPAWTSWRERTGRWKQAYAVRAEPHDVSTPEINFYELAEALSTTLKGGESIVTDAGSAFYVMGQAFRCRSDQRYIVSGAMGAMGFALPASIGMAAANPGKPIICVTGDGSLQTNIQELQTLKHNGMNVKLVVVSNDGYASIRNTQKGFFAGTFVGASRDSGVSTPDLRKIADAYGLPYVRVDDRACMSATLGEAFAGQGPLVIDVIAQPGQVIIPTVTSMKLADGSLRSKPLHLMYPDLPQETIAAEFGDLQELQAEQAAV